MPLHPLVVHLPIALAALMPLVAIGLFVAWWKGALSRRTWVIAVALQAILVVSGFVAMRTGGQEEERVERVVPEAAIEAHEEAAEVMVWAAAAVLLLSAGALVPNQRAARALAGATIAGTVAVLMLGVRAGEAGGALVYQHNAGAAYAPAATPGATPAAPAAHDDDD